MAIKIDDLTRRLMPLQVNGKGELEDILGNKVKAHPMEDGLNIVHTTTTQSSYGFFKDILKTYGGIISDTGIYQRIGFIEGSSENQEYSTNMCRIPVQLYIIQESK